MSIFPSRGKTALVVIDMQNGVLEGVIHRELVLTNINTLFSRARIAGNPVIWVQHSNEEMPLGSEGWKYAAELSPLASEPLVHKLYGDSFEDTDLEKVLSENGVNRLIVTGAESGACVRSTVHGAFTRGYDVTLVSDAHTTGDLTAWGAPAPEVIIQYLNLYWKYQQAPDRVADVLATQAVTF